MAREKVKQREHLGQQLSRLRAVRQRMGFSMDELAFRAGVSRETVRLAEIAPTLMSDRTATLLAKALHVAVEDIR